MWKIYDVQTFLLLATVLDLRLLFRKLFIARPYLLSFLDAGIALQGLITQVVVAVGHTCAEIIAWPGIVERAWPETGA